MTNECYFCRQPVKDFEPVYCCGGQDCGCQGLPIDPPIHKNCVIINLLKNVKKLADTDIRFSGRRSFGPGERSSVELHCGVSRVISNENITDKELDYIMDLSGTIYAINDMADHLIEQLGGSPIKEPSEEHPKKIKNRWEILDFRKL